MEKSRIFLLLLFLWGGVLGCGGGKAEGDDFDKGEIQEDASDAISDATEDVAFDQGKDSSEKKPIADNWVQSFIGNCIMEDHWLSFYDGGKAVHTVLDLNACQEHGVYINEGEYSVDEAGDLNFTIHYGNDSTISRKWTYSVMDNLEIPYLSYPLLFSGKSLNWKSYAKGKEPFSWRRIQEDISAKQGADGYSSIRKLDLKVKLDKAPVPGSDCKMTLQWDAFLSYNDETEKTDTGSTELSCSIKESSSPGVISIKWKDFDYWTEVLKGMGFYNKCSHGMCALVEEAFQSEFLYLKDNPDILFHNGYNAWYAGVKNEPPEALPVCGNAVCEYGEYEWDCQKDCCTPDCNDKQCGDNGCNGSCGSCEAGCSCINGLCAGSCKPACGNGVCDQWENAQTCQQDCKYSVEMFIKGIECETADWNPQITEFIVFLEWITSVPAKCHLLFGLKTLENAGEMWIEEDFSISHKYDLALSF
ncbi:MAG: hypothetical protein FJ088_05515, partial [Deltaproteobacteria bacterium]|nr:hypothetical protein [Deltaproteobacteria bacterium]